jgi:hypothetical protein
MSLTTNKKFLDDMFEALERATPEEKAQMRVKTRERLELPEKREPVLEKAQEDNDASSPE